MMLEAKNVHKRFDGQDVLKGIVLVLAIVLDVLSNRKKS